MGINRKQLSLIIRDDELFVNFIKPYADNGELNNVIIRCLSSYYYNEKVRDLIDDVQQEANSDTVQVKSTQDAINDIRQALAMQSFYAESLQDEMSAGILTFTPSETENQLIISPSPEGYWPGRTYNNMSDEEMNKKILLVHIVLV